ncbi:uncharacterized protein MELLADRAFT_124016 [Melampsora larici-populina 98AG31]|uniref:Secreted protein n=1 Tax=Melampsora larici-populina (strain 98AG31 / pathotype 3-4-7) TaxID=747676 RepID=F4S7W5_MELLP|nr:uncharacterized protein MELLADRAFT_124016 [Melampsora larici-populina 98AG31]EGF99293.1 secreted protein [Melampsora larici-populina 98AG31]
MIFPIFLIFQIIPFLVKSLPVDGIKKYSTLEDNEQMELWGSPRTTNPMKFDDLYHDGSGDDHDLEPFVDSSSSSPKTHDSEDEVWEGKHGDHHIKEEGLYEPFRHELDNDGI